MKERTLQILLDWLERTLKRQNPSAAELALVPRVAQMLLDQAYTVNVAVSPDDCEDESGWEALYQ